MKRLQFLIMMMLLTLSGYSQGYVYISGTVTDSLSGSPVPGHAVTIMSDSTQGFFYYNIVYTDSTGHYWDDIPVMNDSTGVLFVMTLDCQGVPQQVTIYYSPVITQFTQDFVICTSNVICQAFFSYSTDPQGNPNSFQFTDLSAGNIQSWIWDFGDGTGSAEQNPFHSFSGPGTFNTCLTVTGINCTDTYCQEITISDTVYMQLYGQVYAGNFPMQQGIVNIFSLNPDGSFSALNDGCPVDSNGIYFFTLVPQGTYLIQAVPADSSGFIPTYYGDVTNWQSATRIELGDPVNPYNISLVEVPAGSEYYGPGSLTGQITNLGMQRSKAEKANIILMDENAATIGFCRVSNAGQFEFRSLDYGVYNLRAELAGVGSDILKFEISQEVPHLDITLNYAGNSILGVEDQLITKDAFDAFPNPVSERLSVNFNLKDNENVGIRMVSMSGQLILERNVTINQNNSSIDIEVNNYSPGIYSLLITTGSGKLFARKIIISR